MLLESPNIHSPIYVRPFTCQDQKMVAHAAIAGSRQFHHAMVLVLKKNLDLDRESFEKLNILDYFILLLQIRTFFIDNQVIANFTCSCKENINGNFLVSRRLQEIDTVFNIVHNKTIQLENLSLVFDVPQIKDIDYIQDKTLDKYFHLFLRSFNGIDIRDFSYEQRLSIYENLPMDAVKIFDEEVWRFLELNIPDYIYVKCAKCKAEMKETLRFHNTLDMIENLLFRFNYDNCIIEYAVISKNVNLSAEYVSTISPWEKQRYLKVIEEKAKAEESQESSNLSKNTEFGF